uniref:Uncharacterized protein n=1 Tax=Arundo donax TaxID=35708 RepID=A0A0A9D7Z8_ARUDO
MEPPQEVIYIILLEFNKDNSFRHYIILHTDY